jgi:hypothetical protein
MKGRNKVILNQATLCEIVEGWMNDGASTITGDDLVKVTAVTFDRSDETAVFTVEPAWQAALRAPEGEKA